MHWSSCHLVILSRRPWDAYVLLRPLVERRAYLMAMAHCREDHMTNPSDGTSDLYALLIGIDHYLPNTMPDGSSYPTLGGCVRDINHVEAFLKQKFQLPDQRILKLT